ncbi:MAG: IPT/TIG domain-containing protein [Bacteroidales bacterium]
MKEARFSIFFVFLTLLVTGCEDEPVYRDYPRVKTHDVTNITSEGALFAAEIYEPGNGVITDHGFVWGLSQPGIDNDNRVYLGPFGGTGRFTAEVRSTLAEGVTYKVAAFVRSGEYTVYGNTVEFKSLGSMGPVITGFSPGRVLCGDTIVITGRNFSWVRASNIVRLNDATAVVCEPVNDTVLKAVVPFTVSDVENTVSVEIAGNRTNYTKATLIVDLPGIESFSPVAAHWGDTVEIFFRNLREADNLQFLLGDIHLVPIEPYNGRSVRIIVPLVAELDLMTISFSAEGGSFFSDDQFALLPPSVSGFLPGTGFWPDTVTVYGIFHPDRQQAEVLFGTLPSEIISVTRDSLRVIVPEGLIESPVSITYRYKRFASGSVQKFALRFPEIYNVTPTTEFAGGYVTITGDYFQKDYTTVRFNDVEAKLVLVERNRIICEAAGNISGEAEVTVTVSDRTTSYSVPFILANPEVVSFYPETASPGDTITVTCKNFNSMTWLRLSPSGSGMEIVSVSGNAVRAIVPSDNYTSGHVGAYIYRNYTESLISSDGFLTVPEPEISSVTPLSGTEGTLITVTGRNFSTVREFNKITFSGVEVPVLTSTRTQITFLMPLAPGGRDRISLQVCGYRVYSSDYFENRAAWSRLPDLPMTDATCTMDFGDEVFVTAPVGDPSMTVYRFNTGTSTFSPAGTVQTSMISFEQSVVKGDIAYLFGCTYEEANLLAFNRNNLSLYTVSGAPGSLRMGTFLMDGDSVLYAGGGEVIFYSGYVRQFWKYRLSSGTWHRLNDLPFDCVTSNSFTADGRCYAMSVDNKLWEYDPGNDSWETRAPYPGPGSRYLLNTVCNGKAYIGHGSFGNNQVSSYDPVNNVWASLVNEQPEWRFMPLTFEYDGKIYFGSGQSFGYRLTDFWVYDPLLE